MIKIEEIKNYINDDVLDTAFKDREENIYNTDTKNKELEEIKKDNTMTYTRFQEIIKKSQVSLYEKGLREEIVNILAELYKDLQTRKKLKNITLQHIDAALHNFAKANSTTDIKKPKSYFKKCLISALEELQISNQYVTNEGSG